MTSFKVGQPPKKLGIDGILRNIFCGFTVYRTAIRHTPTDHQLDYESFKVKTNDGETISCWHIPLAGAKKCVISYNWFGGTKSDLLLHALEFRKAGYSVFLVDCRGHGDSSGNETTFGWFEGLDVVSTLQYIKIKYSYNTHVLHGISLGATAILRAFYLADITADALILECPFDRMINTVRHRVSHFKLPGFPFGDLLTYMGQLRQNNQPFIFNPAEYATEVTCPSLTLHGSNDPFVLADEAKRVSDNISGESKFVLLNGLEHGSGLLAENTRKEWREVISEFLKKQN